MGSPLLTLASYNEIAGRVAERLAGGRDRSDPLGGWNEEVVYASSGVAQSITAALLEQFPAGIAGLQMQTIDTLARRIVNAAGEFPRAASDEERRLAMRTAARSLDSPLTSTRGAAAMLERSYRDVRDSGLTLNELSRRVNAARSLRNRDRIRFAIRAWQLYERLIAKLGAVDPADVLARAAELASGLRPQASAVLAGFYDMTGAQLALVRALQAVDRLAAVFVPFDRDDEQGWSFANGLVRELSEAGLGPRASGLRIKRAALLLCESRTREEEIRETCDEVARLFESGASSIGIVARSLDSYDVQLFERFSRECGFSISESVPLPLAGHRFGRTVLLLLRLRERNFPRGDVLEIVRGGLRLSARINADKTDSETRYAGLGGGRSADLRQRTFKSPVIGDYIEALAEIETLTERIDSSWLPALIDRFRIETETDLAAIETLQNIAALFRRADRWNRPLDTASLIDAIESASIPRPEARGPRPVWLGDVMHIRGRSFEHLFAVRMQDEIVPQRRVEDPLLVDADRRLLGLREIGDGRAEEQLLFRVVSTAARDSLTLSFAASDGFGKPLRKSHYLRRFTTETQRAQRPSVSSVSLWFKRPLQLFVRSGTKSVFDGYVRSPLVRQKAEEALQSIAPTHLEDFGECPQKFFWKRILRVRSIDDPEMEIQINHRDKGLVDHRILERFHRDGLPLDALDGIVDEEFDAFEEQHPPINEPMRQIERRVARTLLRQFVTGDLADLAALALRPARFEFTFDPLILDVEGTPLRIEGTIDRIDEGSGRYRIIDYKSGKAIRHQKLASKIDRGVRLQLALYAMAAANVFQTTPDRVSGAIKPIAGADRPADFAFELAEHESRLRETLALFVAAIRRGDFPAFPNEGDNDFDACKYCPVNHSCRTRHDADEKRSVLRAGEPRALFEDPS